ncbi:MAG TPA: hypothetical protein VFY29_17500 [Terriglobia bacterium]|nr:hypothetical protein [Terriglobia bacterium]
MDCGIPLAVRHTAAARFQFTFRARFAINAQTALSTAYEYYNPDAEITLAPTRFIVQ